jgi:isopenicillin-N N-acyltransferase-like protein
MFIKIVYKVFKWFFISVFLLIGIIIICYNLFVKIPPPKNNNNSIALTWKRDTLSSNLYVVKNNWLRKSETGLWELYLEGSPFERGAASGNLCKELLYDQEIAFTQKLKDFVPNDKYLSILKYLIAWFNRNLDEYIPAEYQLEIYGESFYGPKDFEIIGENYPRMLNYHAAHDIGHALINSNLVGCTSFSAKNNLTESGSLLIARNFDFNMGDDFAKHKIVMFISPDNGYKHALITWPGFFGAVSGMNEKGLTVTLNAAPSEVPLQSATPISILAREILQYASNTKEAISIASKTKTFVSELILIGSEIDNKSIIIEKTPDQISVVDQSNDLMICANHFQSDLLINKNKNQFESTSTLYRESRMNELLDGKNKINPLRAIEILRNRLGTQDSFIGFGNENALNQLAAHHSVVFMPKEKLMWVSCNPYQLGAFVCYNLDSVFSKAPHIRNNQREFYDKEKTVSEDAFIHTKEFLNWEKFKTESQKLQNIINHRLNSKYSNSDIQEFIKLNPEFYRTYELIGDYYLKSDSLKLSLNYYENALQKDIPINNDRNKIVEKIKWIKNKLN